MLVGEGSFGLVLLFWNGDMINVFYDNINGVVVSYFFFDKDSMYNVLYSVVECVDDIIIFCCCIDEFLDEFLFEIEEDIIVFYVMVKFSGDGFRGNVGMCYVEIDLILNGYDLIIGEVVVFDGGYNEWLLSINLLYDLFEDVLLCMVVVCVFICLVLF